MTSRPRRNRILNFARKLVILLVLVAGAGYVASWWLLDLNRYKPRIIAMVERNTNLPCELGELELRWRPTPRVTVHGAVFGEDEFRAEVPELVVEGEFWPLLRGKFHITQVTAGPSRVHVPREWNALRDAIAAIGPREDRRSRRQWVIALDRIDVPDVRVFVDGEEPPGGTLRIALEDVMTTAMSVEAEGAVPFFGPDARLELSGVVRPRWRGSPEPASYAGTARLSDAVLAWHEGAPAVLTSFETEVDGTVPWDYEASVSGVSRPTPHAPPLYRQTDGTARALVRFAQGRLQVDDAEFVSEAGRAWGSAQRTPAGLLTIRIDGLETDAPGAFIPLLPIPGRAVTLHAREDAVLHAQDVLITAPPSGIPVISEGEATIVGIDIDGPDGAPIVRGLAARVTPLDGGVAFTASAENGARAEGAVMAEPSKGLVTISASGQALLTRELLAPMLGLNGIPSLNVLARLEALSVSYDWNKNRLFGLETSGQLEQGDVELAFPAYRDRLSDMTTGFHSEGTLVKFAGSGHSAVAGRVDFETAYDLDERLVEGEAQADLSQMDPGQWLSPEWAERCGAVLGAYGQAPYRFTVTLPETENGPLTVEVARAALPPVSVQAAFARAPGGWQVVSSDIEATAPAPALAAIVGDPLFAEGLGSLHLWHDVDEGLFKGTLDLSECAVQFHTIRKAPGVPCAIALAGEARGQWQPETAELTLADERFTGRFEQGRLKAEGLALDLDELEPFLVHPVELRGALRGRLAFAPFEAEVTLDGLRFAMADAPPIEQANGTAQYRSGRWEFRIGELRGAGSDLAMSASLENDQWEGRLTGANLDLDAVIAFFAALRAFQPETVPAAPAPRPHRASIEAQVERVQFRRGEAQGVSGRIISDGPGFRIEQLALTPYTGRVTGAVSVEGADTPTRRLSLELALDRADARLLEEIVYDEPRYLRGQLTGTAALSIPLAGYEQRLHGLDGVVQVTGENGSLGKFGLTTKLIAALRTLEILWLRLPPLRDEGLPYDALDALVRFEEGVATVETFEARGPTVAFDVTGGIHFPRDSVDLHIRAYPLEVIGGLAERVPVLGHAVRAVRPIRGVRLYATGPVADPSVRLIRTENTNSEDGAE